MQNEERAKKLLAQLEKLKESAFQVGNIKEAENAAMRIMELQAKYNITMADAINPDENPMGYLVYPWKEKTGRNEGKWVIMMVSSISQFNFCRCVISNNTMNIHGTQSNRRIVAYLVDQLIAKARIFAKEEFGKYNGDTKRNTWYRGFYVGFVQGVSEKLKEQEKTLETTEPEYGLVRTNQLTKVVEDIRKTYSNLGRAKSSSYSGRDAMGRGREVGKNTSINAGVGGRSHSGKYLN